MAGYLFDSPEDEDALFARIESSRRALATYYGAAQQATAERATGLAGLYPWLTPGVALGLAKGGVEPGTPVAEAAAVAQVEEKEHRGFLGSIGHTVGGALKGTARVGLAALSAPVEAAQAQFRNVVSGDPRRILGGAVSSVLPYNPLADEKSDLLRQTTVGTLADAAVADIQGKGPIDTGSGFFVGGQVAAEQARRARASGSITYDDGSQHAITPGRFVARWVAEPGTRPYSVLSGTVDAAVAFADPTPGELGKGKQFVSVTKTPLAARAAQKVAEKIHPKAAAQTGLVSGTRRTVLPEVADQWFSTTAGRRTVQRMADEGDFQTLWVATGKKMPVGLTAQIADARTPEEVMGILRPAIGITLREKPKVGGLGPTVSKRLSGVRAFQGMPGHSLPLDDLDQAVETLDRFQRNARLPAEVIAANNGRLARAENNIDVYRVVVNDVLGGLDGALKAAGADAKQARTLTRAWGNYHAELTRYFVDEIGENAIVPGAVIDGFGKALPTPHLYAEYLHSAIPLPNARDIRAVTSRFSGIVTNPAVKTGVAAGDFVMQEVWKPMVLLRAAWTVRVVGEEQIRMGASGLNSLFAHPLSALAWVTGRKGVEGLTGEPLADAEEFGKAMSQRSGGWRDDAIRTQHKVLVRADEDDFARSWADELAQLHSDPVARRVAAGGLGDGDLTPGDRAGIVGIKNWFYDGAGRKFRKEMAASSGRDDLLTRAGSDVYVETVLARVKVKTADHPELLDAAATGRLGKHSLSDAGRPAKGALARLDELTEQGVGPQVVKGDLLVRARKGGGSDFAARYDRGVEVMFNTLMTRPTNYLSRSSTFKQFYWRRAEELLPFMDPQAQRAAAAQARAAGLKDVAARMDRVRANGVAGTLGLSDADVVAKGFGLDETRKLLYDLSEKSQLADMMRLVTPFAEAWKEILTRWAKIGSENPKVARLAQQGIEGARGQGIFHTNENGEEVFSYSGSGWLTQKALGVRVPLEGRVAGLNLFSSSVIPGVGPVISIPAGHLIPDRPEWDGVRKMLLPFGPQDTSGGFGESFLPPWAQKFRIALGKGSPEQDRQYANTVMDLARAMAASGKYPTSTPEQVDRLLSDARSKAKVLYLIRGAAQYVAPSAPTPTVMAQDKEGRMVVADLLVKDYRTMQDTVGYDKAVGAFLAKYGQDALLYMQPKTRALADVPATKEALDFVRRNPGLAKKYPLVYGLFVPQGGDFDFEAYRAQIERGTREQVNPEQAVQLANARVANWIYQQAKDKAGDRPGKAARDWLANIRKTLEKAYPGYGDYTGLTERATAEQRIEQVTDAVKDPKLAATPTGKAVSLYLTARAKAQQQAEAMGLRGFATAQKAEGIRTWLRTIGETIAANEPGFTAAWERLFADEVAPPAGEEAA